MTPIDPKQIGEAATWLSITAQLYSSRMSAMLAPHNMTLGQFSILHHLARPELRSGTRISDIAAAIEMQQPAVTKAIAKFENMGLVSLEPATKDKRVKNVVATPKAAQLLQDIRVGMGPDLGRMFSALDAGRLSEFTADIKKLGQWLDQNRLSD